MGSSKHTPTDKVWRGVLVLRKHFPVALSELKQKDADAVLRATQWAEARRSAHETREHAKANPPPRWDYELRRVRFSKLSGGNDADE